MIIENIQVEAFRGIRNRVEVDFTAPLTVIYAPNGTGKTTICDALEWLLTGRIERLSGGEEDVRCHFGGDEQPYVEAVLRIGGESFRVRRRYDPSGVVLERWGAGTDEFTITETSTLLASVTGLKVTAGTEPRRAQEIRATWLRASRLLSGPALNLLLDPAEADGRAQSLAFSELLGVGNLQKQEQELESVLHMLEQKEIERQLRDLSAEIDEMERSAELAGPPASATLRAEAAAHLAATAELLQVNVALDPDEAMQEIRVRFADEREVADRQTDALTRIQPALPQHLQKSRQAALLQQEMESLAEDCRLLKTERETLLRGMDAFRAEQDQLAFELEELSRLHGETEADLGLLRACLNEAERYGIRISDPPRVDDAEVEAREAAIALDRQNERQARLVSSIRNLGDWRQISSRLAEWEAELAEIEALLPSAEEETELQRHLLEAADELGRLRARRSDLLTPLQSVQAAAEALLGNLVNSPECPLCGHRHATSEALREAMEAAIAAGPPAASGLASEIAGLKEEIVALENRQWGWARLRDRRGRLIESTRYPEAVLKEAQKQLELVGLTLQDLERDDLRSDLDRMLRGSEQEVEAAKDRSKQASGALRSLRALDEAERRFIRRMAEYEAIMGERHGAASEQSATAHPGTWSSRLREAAKLIGVRLEASRTRLAELESTINWQRLQVASVDARLDLVQGTQEELGRRLRTVLSAIRAFEEDWRALESTAPPSEQALEAATRLIMRRREEISRITVHLDEAKDRLEEARFAGAKEVADQGRREEAARKQTRRRELEVLMEHCEAIGQALQQIREQKKRSVERQLEPLLESITPLYVRAQANSVYDRISYRMSPSGDVEWRAEAGGIRLERIVELSQGQRQNLALAIFLARARSLGGTFFLDEPLAHLDDINRVAFLDMLRVVVAERPENPPRIVLTTADLGLVRHLREKLGRILRDEPSEILRTYHLHGNPHTGVRSDMETVPALQAEAAVLTPAAVAHMGSR